MKAYSADLAFRKWLLVLFSAVLIILGLCVTFADGQEWKPLLGKKHYTGMSHTQLDIGYISNGYDEPKRKWIAKKLPKFLAGVPHLIEPATILATQMTEDRAFIRDVIDEAYTEQRDIWRGCGGQYASAADRVLPSSLTVVLEDVPFLVNTNPPDESVYGKAVHAYGTTDGLIIRVVVLSTSGLSSDPANASLVTLKAILKNEIGNTFQIAMSGRPGNVNNEIGARSPCGN